MSVHPGTFQALKDMGIEPVLARAAATRFHTIEPAVNWCFGDGMNWKPDTPKDELPSYSLTSRTDGATVTHHEVLDHSSDDTPPSTSAGPHFSSHHHDVTLQPPTAHPHGGRSPPLPPRPGATNLSTLATPKPPTQFASNNPFRTEPAPTPRQQSTEDEDEELQRALALSRQEMDVDELPKEEDRSTRERSARASGAPPPSPNSEAQGLAAPVFGPSEKTDTEGKMAMVPASQNPPPPTQSKEDEELDRAIADSLMTASFHSASALQEDGKPENTPRQPEAPLVFWSQSGRSTYAANFMQAMFAVPQLREAVQASFLPEDDASRTHLLNMQDLLDKMSTENNSFIEVDSILAELRKGFEPNQLPPQTPTLSFHGYFTDTIQSALTHRKTTDLMNLDEGDFWDNPKLLFGSQLELQPLEWHTFVNLQRNPAKNYDVQSAIASILWNDDSNAPYIVQLASILTINLEWMPGAPRELWKLEERVVLDRFLSCNAAWSTQIRANQALAQGHVKRLQERISLMTMFKDHSIIDSITTAIKHYETSPGDDPVQIAQRAEMKQKLEKTLNIIKDRVAEATEKIAEAEHRATGGLFETDDPKYNQHAYVLRGILFHDGALVAGKHLYAYVRNEAGWWKIQEHEATRVEWKDIANDNTGLFMDGGAYMLIYSREGPRPASESPPITPNQPAQSESDPIVGGEADLVGTGDHTDASVIKGPEDSIEGGQAVEGDGGEEMKVD